MLKLTKQDLKDISAKITKSQNEPAEPGEWVPIPFNPEIMTLNENGTYGFKEPSAEYLAKMEQERLAEEQYDRDNPLWRTFELDERNLLHKIYIWMMNNQCSNELFDYVTIYEGNIDWHIDRIGTEKHLFETIKKLVNEINDIVYHGKEIPETIEF